MQSAREQRIIVCYLRSSSALLEDHILNRLAALLAPKTTDGRDPVVHVELYFPDKHNRDTGVSAGIHYGGQMFMYPKQFRRADWTFHSIPATERQVALAKSFCERQRGASFNYPGFFLPGGCNIGHGYRARNLPTKRMPWYCSELVAYALMYAGIIDESATKSARLHPQSSYDIIQSRCDTYMDSARSLQGDILQL